MRTTLTIQNVIDEVLNRECSFRNGWYHSIQSILLTICCLKKRFKAYETIILSLVICGYETICVTLKKKRGQAVVDYRKIEKLHNECLYGLYSSPDFRMIK